MNEINMRDEPLVYELSKEGRIGCSQTRRAEPGRVQRYIASWKLQKKTD